MWRTATWYLVVAMVLGVIIERSMAVAVPRLLATVALAYGLPLVVLITWILRGPGVYRRAALTLPGLLLLGALVWCNNGALRAATGRGPYLVAHRGVHQRLHAERGDPMACVGRIHPPAHRYIENTVPSIAAAFAHGARFVEIDIRPTSDGDFAVFHDELVDCKTDQRGPVASRTMNELRALDAGYGYFTADGAHPLRGQGISMIRSLAEILAAFPDKGFIVDAKFGNDAALWTRLTLYLGRLDPDDQRRVAVHGAPGGVQRVRTALPNIITGSRESALLCARGYMILGWTGYIPASCRRAMVGTYADTGWMFWGWPGLFVERMDAAGSIVIIRRRAESEQALAASLPAGYSGGVQTDHVESFRAWMNPVP